MNRALQLLSLCKRAGKLVLGFDAVKESLQKGQARWLVQSSDLSEHTQKEVHYLSEQFHVPLLVIPDTLDELWRQLGKRAGVFSVTDQALGEKLAKEAGWAGGIQEEKR